jgi:hypothetical protein
VAMADCLAFAWRWRGQQVEGLGGAGAQRVDEQEVVILFRCGVVEVHAVVGSR